MELLAANNLAACRQANNWIQASHFPASDSQATAVLYSKHPQTKNSFNHLAACLNMLRTVSSTWLGHCFQKCKISKSNSSPGAGTASSHYMGLAQVHWSHSLTCRIRLKTQRLLLPTATYSHRLSSYPSNLPACRKEVQTLTRVVFGRSRPDSTVSMVQSTKTMFVSQDSVDNKCARTFADH